MMSRSRAMSSERSSGRTTSSDSTWKARSASRTGRRVQYTVDSRSVAALDVPPTPSMASETSREVGSACVPRNVMCSMKWARPERSRLSWRDPTRT